jgi:hypothetical protein
MVSKRYQNQQIKDKQHQNQMEKNQRKSNFNI